MGEDLLRVHHIPPREEREERRVRPGQRELDRVVAEHLDTVLLEEVRQHPRRARVEPERPHERPAHGLRSHGVAGVKPRVLHEVEGPGPRVGRALPALGEPWEDLRRVAGVLDQGVVERLLHHADRPVVLHARVDRRHFLPSREDENRPVAHALEPGDGRGDDERRQRHGHEAAHANPSERHPRPPPAATGWCAAAAAG